jgi:hypothetical protein
MKLILSCPNFSFRCVALLACAVVCAAAVPSAGTRSIMAADEPSAEEVLQAHGLQRVGRTWCFPEESELRDRLNGLDRFEQRLVGAQRTVDEIIAENETCHGRLVQFEQLEKQSRVLDAAAKPGTAQRIQLDAQVKGAATAVEQLKRLYIRPEQFGLSAPLKPALNDLVVIRADLMVRLLPMQEAMDRLTKRYDALHNETGLTAAIASLKTSDLLGPSRNLLDGWKIVDKLQPMVFSDALPVSREGHFYRVAAIVNERQPLTFSFVANGGFVGTGEPTLIPQNLAEAAGLTVDAKAPQIKLRVANGRDEMTWRIKVPQLRFGRQVLRDVDAYILAPEAADIGARIGAGAFAGYHVQLDADHLLLTFGGGK